MEIVCIAQINNKKLFKNDENTKTIDMA